MSDLRSICPLLTQAQTVALLCHQNPDGDAVGSSVALYLALQKLDKKPVIVCPHTFPAIFCQIVGPVTVTHIVPEADLYLLLDCSELHRTGFETQIRRVAKLGRPIASLDHHAQSDIHQITPYAVTSKTAAATAELVYELLTQIRTPIDGPIATALLLGLYTDTGGFRHPNTSSRVLQLASRLIYYGASLALINQTFHNQLGPKRQRLWGKILAGLELNKWGIVIAKITLADMAHSQVTIEDLTGLANMLALTSEAKAALVLMEGSNGWRGTLRTRHSDVDLGYLSRLLGGRGQQKAAGFTTTTLSFSGKIEG